jgi:hypothetical protein
VTINLDQGDEGAVDKEAEHRVDLEFEESIKNAIQIEVSNFYIDYGLCVAGEIFGALAMICAKFVIPDRTYQTGSVAMFVALTVLHTIRVITRKSDSKLRKLIVTLEICSSILLAGASALYHTELYFIPMFLSVFLYLIQVAFTCLNLADAIDHTFIFKLVFKL